MLNHRAILASLKLLIRDWLRRCAPWFRDESMIAGALAKPPRWKADTLAKILLTDDERTRLKAWIIGAVDCTKAQREPRRREQNLLAKEAKRRADGAKPRAQSLTAQQRCHVGQLLLELRNQRVGRQSVAIYAVDRHGAGLTSGCGRDEIPAMPTVIERSDADVTRVRNVKWFHCFDFGGGLYSHDARSANMMRGKADLVFRYPIIGKSVLDIGAWDGFFSFEAERRGASRVLATDHFCWSGAGWGTQEGFRVARSLIGSRVEDQEIDIPNINPETVGRWDVVLLLGVIYHVWDVLSVLKTAYDVSNEMAIIETALDLENVARPAMSFVRGALMPRPDVPLSNDSTNFFGPNSAAVVAMLEYVGFRRIEKFVVQGESSQAPRGFFWAFK
jgi:tRNA (mo5U34)-methyltransferase